MRSETARNEHCEYRSVLVSGCYKAVRQRNSSPIRILIEHCCLMTKGYTWKILIKCRPLLSHDHCSKTKDNLTPGSWRNVVDVFPGATVEEKHNDIEVTFPPLLEEIEVAAFGTPGKDDQKRMQMAIFGKRPTYGKDWKILVYLVDDTITAVKQVCQKEEEMGNRLLTALAGLFVSNSDEDIRIEFTALEPGWQIKGNKVKAIKSRDAWNSPENSKDFAQCDFTISHVDNTKQRFFCGVTVSHVMDSVDTEVVALFEKEAGKDIKQPPPSSKGLKRAWDALLNDTIVPTIYDLHGFLNGSGLEKQAVKG